MDTMIQGTVLEVCKKRWKISGVRNVSLIDSPERTENPGLQYSEDTLINIK